MRPPSSILARLILSSREHGTIALDETNEPSGADGIVTASASGQFGILNLWEISDEGYSVRHGHFQISRNVNLTSILDVSYLGMFINLGPDIAYSQDGIRPGVFKKKQCTLMAAPYLHMKTELHRRRSYSFLDITFSTEYLRKWERAFPSIGKVLKLASKGTPLLEHFTIPAKQEGTINRIINLETVSVTNAMVKIKREINELLFILFDLYERTASSLALKPGDVEKIQAVRDMLIENIQDRISIRKLAQHAGMNEFKLKHGFKKVMGMPVHRFQIEERMKKAKDILEQGDRPINEIAVMVGYRNLSSFSAAFKKRFGYPPSTIK